MVTDCRLTVPPALVVRLVRLVTPPTAAPKSVAPVELTVRFLAPFTVPEKVMTPVPVDTVASVLRVVAPATLNALLVVA